jgi:hypothetical protein
MGAHFQKATNQTTGQVLFGTPTNRDAYQDPREYRISFGLRF